MKFSDKSQSQRQRVFNDRSTLHSWSLSLPPAAHGVAHSAVTASSVAAAASAAAITGIHSQTRSLIARYNNLLDLYGGACSLESNS